jgi:NAD(P)-dependent dehydrogenase (short-subunit alcohol dehydrogenase family)
MEAALDHTIAVFGTLDILINNAGIAMHRALGHVEPERSDRIFRINA